MFGKIPTIVFSTGQKKIGYFYAVLLASFDKFIYNLAWKKYMHQGRLAQLVERFIYTEDVGGSSPSSSTEYD